MNLQCINCVHRGLNFFQHVQKTDEIGLRMSTPYLWFCCIIFGHCLWLPQRIAARDNIFSWVCKAVKFYLLNVH